MKLVNTSSLLVLLALSLHSCTKITGEGPVVTETRNIKDFGEVAASFSGDVVYKQDPQFKVEIHAQRNIIDIIETPVINNELVVRYKKNYNVRDIEPVTVYVSSPTISSLRVDGSGTLETTGNLVSDY